jgi:hypothetical protein
MKISPVGAESFCVDRWMDGQTDTMELIVAFHTSASMHINFSLLKVTLFSLAEVYCNCRGIRCLHTSVTHTNDGGGRGLLKFQYASTRLWGITLLTKAVFIVTAMRTSTLAACIWMNCLS